MLAPPSAGASGSRRGAGRGGGRRRPPSTADPKIPKPDTRVDGRPVRLFLDPPSHHFTEDRLFAGEAAKYGGDDLMAPFRAVRDHFTAAGIPTHTADRIPQQPDDALSLVVSFGQRVQGDHYARLAERPGTVLSAYIPIECPIVDVPTYRRLPEMSRLFRRVFSWSDPEGLQAFTGTRVETLRYHIPQSFDDVHAGLWARRDRKFLVMINTNKLPRMLLRELYTERLRALEFFHRYGEIDLYGRYWDRMPITVGATVVPWTLRIPLERVQRRLWNLRQRIRPNPLYAAAQEANRGPVSSKSETLSGYEFAICFENMVQPGYITEKIFDCFLTGTIPVYLGAPEIAAKVPAACFIDMRDFADYAGLRSYLKSLTPAARDGYREAARDFIRSPRFDPFRKSTFVDLFRRLVAEDAGVSV